MEFSEMQMLFFYVFQVFSKILKILCSSWDIFKKRKIPGFCMHKNIVSQISQKLKKTEIPGSFLKLHQVLFIYKK